jgi:hypothetical protein
MRLAKGDRSKITIAIERWRHWQPSRILFHHEDCCLIAHEWFIAMARSHLTDGIVLKGPHWIRQRWNWGPSKWPLYWCQVEKLDTLDCGALGVLAQEAFKVQGATTFPVQLIRQFHLQDTQQWRQKWESGTCLSNWILDDLAYHEACAVIRQDSNIEIWDPTDSCWISPEARGYGAIVALCVDMESFEPRETLVWGSLNIQPNTWVVVEVLGSSP